MELLSENVCFKLNEFLPVTAWDFVTNATKVMQERLHKQFAQRYADQRYFYIKEEESREGLPLHIVSDGAASREKGGVSLTSFLLATVTVSLPR